MKYFLLFALISLIACQPGKKAPGDMITVSILPQKYFVDQISGGKIKVNVLVPPGSSPHNYSVLPSQMKELAKSKIWFQVGLLTFEEAWKEKFAETNKELTIANSSVGIDLIAGSDDDHDHEHHGSFDPHVWLAPNDVKIMALNILMSLKNAFPEQAPEFEKNYEKFALKIDSLSQQIDSTLSKLKNRNILIFHPTMGYFARQFRLGQIPLELDGKEPSPRHLKEMVDLAREQHIKVIFIQKEFDTENALQLSREISGKVETIDPLAYDWDQQLIDIARKIASQE